ncbi:MAG: TolC family protein [Imperialibacter sp.]|uniref:TolC family protein n=1 Tax=Imperialibacter sp. TaxID=2038411 RepID=UPI0032EE69D4
MKRIIYFLLIVPLLSQAQPASYQLSLEDAVLMAIENSPLLKKAGYEKEIAQAQARQAVGGYLPQVKASSQFTDNFALPEQQLPGEVFGQPGTTIPVKFGVRYGVSAGLEASQVIYNQQLIAGVKSAASLEALMHYGELSSKEELVYNVSQAYLQIQVTRQQRELVKSNLERVDRLYQNSKAQFDNGIIKENSVKQLAVNFQNTETQLLEVGYNLDQLTNLLKFHLSIDQSTELVLTSDLITDNKIILQDELSLESNIQYRQLLQQENLSLINEKYEKAAYVPSLNAFMNFGYTGQTNDFKFSGANYNSFNNGTWGLSVSIPVFDGFQRRNKLQIAQIETKQVLEDKKYLEHNINMNYQNAESRIRLSRKQASAQKANMVLAQDVYEATTESFQEGVSPLSELLDAENSLLEAQANYLTNLLQLKLAELDHLKASGQLAQIVENIDINNQ